VSLRDVLRSSAFDRRGESEGVTRGIIKCLVTPFFGGCLSRAICFEKNRPGIVPKGQGPDFIREKNGLSQSRFRNTYPLRLAGEGERVRIVSFAGGKTFNARLAGMGLNLGVEVEILQNRGCGKMLIGHEGDRFFLGGGMAHKIQVIPVEGGFK